MAQVQLQSLFLALDKFLFPYLRRHLYRKYQGVHAKQAGTGHTVRTYVGNLSVTEEKKKKHI